jgi:hypothetical protein
MFYSSISGFIFLSKCIVAFSGGHELPGNDMDPFHLMTYDYKYCLDYGDWAMENTFTGANDYGIFHCDKNNTNQKFYYYDNSLRNYDKTLCLDGIENKWRFKECNGGGTQMIKFEEVTKDHAYLIKNENNNECLDHRLYILHSPCPKYRAWDNVFYVFNHNK